MECTACSSLDAPDPAPRFVPDLPGTYVLELVVTNEDDIDSLPATAQSDADAEKCFLARTCSGQGSRPGREYLDIAVEFSGYIYVLSTDASHAHRLDIYHPTQTGALPICTTRNLNAARHAVDFWRNVYSLNYEVLTLPGGGIPGFTEPSVSLWVPPPPG